MNEMKIEWVVGLHLESKETSTWHVPVVRLNEVDQVIAEAVKFAKYVRANAPLDVDIHKDAARFLDLSLIVAQWRKRQEGKP